jgi:hypothetical protein
MVGESHHQKRGKMVGLADHDHGYMVPDMVPVGPPNGKSPVVNKKVLRRNAVVMGF